MPIRAQSYASNLLMPVFSMNLPEGYLFDLIARRIAKHERIDDMRLLAITGQRQIGACNSFSQASSGTSPRPRSVSPSCCTSQPRRDFSNS